LPPWVAPSSRGGPTWSAGGCDRSFIGPAKRACASCLARGRLRCGRPWRGARAISIPPISRAGACCSRR
jgi:hypothetical protein